MLQLSILQKVQWEKTRGDGHTDVLVPLAKLILSIDPGNHSSPPRAASNWHSTLSPTRHALEDADVELDAAFLLEPVPSDGSDSVSGCTLGTGSRVSLLGTLVLSIFAPPLPPAASPPPPWSSTANLNSSAVSLMIWYAFKMIRRNADLSEAGRRRNSSKAAQTTPGESIFLEPFF